MKKDDTVVITSGGQDERRTSSTRRKVGIVAAVFVVCLVAGGALVWWMWPKQSEQGANDAQRTAQLSQVCASDVIKKAGKAIDANNLSALRSVWQRVQKLDNHQQDINCNYIDARYYLMAGMADECEKSVALIRENQAAGAVYSNDFGTQRAQPAELDGYIATLRASNASLDGPGLTRQLQGLQ